MTHVAKIPTIAPVGNWIDRPLWSIMIPAYRCVEYLRATLESVGEQLDGLASTQIAVVVDGSEDLQQYSKTVGAANRHYGCDVELIHDGVQRGAMGNFNRCIDLSTGRYVHILHGDDVVRPGFYQAVEAEFGSVGCDIVVVNAEDMSHDGKPIPGGLVLPGANPPPFLYGNPFRASAVVMRRSVYETLGGFDEALPHCGDWETWVRAITNYDFGMSRVGKTLCGYRQHGEMDTWRMCRNNAANLRDFLRVGEVFAARYGRDFDPAFFRNCVRGCARVHGEIMRNGGDWDGWAACEAFLDEIGRADEEVRA